MDLISDTGSRDGILRSFPAVLAASLVVVVCLNWLPVLSLFFSAPLFVLFFGARKSVYGIAVLVSFFLDAVVSILVLFSQSGMHKPADILPVCAGAAFFLFPLFVMLLPGKIRLCYRTGIIGFIAAGCWALFFLISGETAAISSMLREMAEKVSVFLQQYIPEGYEGSVLKLNFSASSLYTMMLNTLLYSILPFPVAMYTLCAGAGYKITSWAGKNTRIIKPLSAFYNDFFLFIPLAFGMCGIMAGQVFKNQYISVISWNIALAAGFYFVLQGFGILSFFLGLVRRRTGRTPFWPFLLFILLLISGILLYFIGILLIAGVVELFVPLRQRFVNKDIIDPTPGRGNDHT